MAGQFPYSSAAGEVIIKGLLAKLDMTIPQLCAATGLGYSALQRLYNGETKRITQPVYDALKKRWPHLRDEFGFTRQFVFYSARHTFAQLCHELGVPDSVLAYCIGDVPRSGSIDFYRQTTRRMADRYIRRVFDFVSSDKSIDDVIDESGEGV